MKRIALFLGLVALLMVACESSDNYTPPAGNIGAYILCEGSGSGTTISLFNEDSAKVWNDYFKNHNNQMKLGVYGQSMMIANDKAFIVITTGDNNGHVEVVDMNGFKTITQIDKFAYPREIIAVSDSKGYFTNGNGLGGDPVASDEVIVLDLESNSAGKVIKVGAGPEKMLKIGSKLFVANSGGWVNNDNTISVIDINKDEVIETHEVELVPVDMDVDKNGMLWVLCIGPYNAQWTRDNSKLVKLNPNTGEKVVFDLGIKSGSGIKNLAMSKNGAYVYYTNNGVYRMSVDASELPTEKLVTKDTYADVTFYGMDVNPQNGDLYCFKQGDEGFGTPGKLVIFNSEGEYKTEYIVGIAPNSAVFNF